MRWYFLLPLLIFTADISTAQTPDSLQVFRCFGDEQMPEFRGGQESLLQYLSAHLQIPDSADDRLQSRCVVKFFVERDGRVSDPQIVKSAGKTIDAEVLHIVKSMPRWKPGKKWGKPVKTIFFLPVTVHFE